jgi:predicted amidohydrolase YtcJ
MPDRTLLDSLFPSRPVMLTRIDGHAVLVNAEALRQASITAGTRISGGEIQLKDGKPSGILIDNAIDLVKNILPATSAAEKTEALLNAQQNCLAMGITSVDDAGLMHDDIHLMDELQKKEQLKMRVYAMLSDSAPNYKEYLEKGPFKTDRLHVCSFKFYIDGALGSRGACLLKEYNDKKNWQGFLLGQISHFEEAADLLAEKGFQMNAHCIGDSAVRLMLGIYGRHCKGDGKKRWRLEHAQVINENDFAKFNRDIIPSVQPTHATSDMYWAKDRLGERVKGAYAYKRLLDASGRVALGTDFPVEEISPFKTFYASVARKDAKGWPQGGFQPENKLSREETLKGMTIWAAYSNFEEKEKGSIEKGKFADFIVLDRDIMHCHEHEILSAKVLANYINGEEVWKRSSAAD